MRHRLLCSLLLLPLLAGCGSKDGPEDQVRSTVTRFGDASAKKDYQTICDELLDPALVKKVEQINLPCELALKQGLGDVKAPTLKVGVITVKDKTATARVTSTATGQKPSSDTLALKLVDDEWRIASLR